MSFQNGYVFQTFTKQRSFIRKAKKISNIQQNMLTFLIFLISDGHNIIAQRKSLFI